MGKQGRGLTDEVRLAASEQLSPTLTGPCAVQSQALVPTRKPRSSDALRQWSLKPKDICAAKGTCGAEVCQACKLGTEGENAFSRVKFSVFSSHGARWGSLPR